MRIVFFDTETTGGGPEDRLCQLAVKEWRVEEPIVSALYKPPVPITIGAMCIHHITPKMVAERPSFTEAPEYPALKELFESDDVVAIAHNVAFDRAMLAREGIMPKSTVCTCKVARALDPNEMIGKYSLQHLRYALELDVEAAAHDAWGDVLVLEAVFERLLAKLLKQAGSEEAALKEMIEVSARPTLFTTLRFGKHNGKRIEEVARIDREYLEWLLRTKREHPVEEEDWIYTLEHHLAKA